MINSDTMATLTQSLREASELTTSLESSNSQFFRDIHSQQLSRCTFDSDNIPPKEYFKKKKDNEDIKMRRNASYESQFLS